MKRKTNRTRQAEETKRKILKTGMCLISEKGIDSVSINDIVKESGTSVGTFYHYYESKLDLFMDFYKSVDKRFNTEIDDNMKQLAPKDAILYFFDEYAILAVNDGVSLMKSIYVPENSWFLDDDRSMHKVLHSAIKRVKESGFSKNKTSEQVKGDLMLLGRGVIFDWALHDGEYDIRKKMKDIISTYLISLNNR